MSGHRRNMSIVCSLCHTPWFYGHDCTEDHEGEVGEEATERGHSRPSADPRKSLEGAALAESSTSSSIVEPWPWYRIVERLKEDCAEHCQCYRCQAAAEIERLTRELRTAERAIDGYTEEVAALNYKCLSEEDLRLRLTRELAKARELIAAAKNLNFHLTWASTEILHGSTRHELHTQGVAMDERLGDYLTRKEGGE